MACFSPQRSSYPYAHTFIPSSSAAINLGTIISAPYPSSSVALIQCNDQFMTSENQYSAPYDHLQQSYPFNNNLYPQYQPTYPTLSQKEPINNNNIGFRQQRFNRNSTGDMYNGMDLESSFLDDTLRKDHHSHHTSTLSHSNNPVQVFFQPASVRMSSSSINDSANGVAEADEPPLLEPDYYFGDILGEDAVPPQALPTISTNDENNANFQNIPPPEPQYIDQSIITDEEISTTQLPSNAPPTAGPSTVSAAYNNPSNIRASYVSQTPQPQPYETSLSTLPNNFKKTKNTRNSISKIRSALNKANRTAQESAQQKILSSPLSDVAYPLGMNNSLNQFQQTSPIPQQPLALPIDLSNHNQNRSIDNGLTIANNVSFQMNMPTSPITPKASNTSATTTLSKLPLVNNHIDEDGENALFNCDALSITNSDTALLDSPISGTSSPSMTHPDQYENLDERTQQQVDMLQLRISKMPRRKLREYLGMYVALEDVEPLMGINRDELAGMLGLGVTTWKTFMHSLGVPRWPARAIKSQHVKEKKLVEKKKDARKKGDSALISKIDRELNNLRYKNSKKRENLKTNAKVRVSSTSVVIKKKKYI